jgi:FkbM family methyltransferase
MYSQNDEEAVIEGWFKQAGISEGRFLDIGAYDGKAFSNTYRLVELGWGGVCIEPSPSVFPALLKLHGDNQNIELVNAAVGVQPSLLTFYDSNGDAISTTSVQHMEKWQKGWSVNYKKFLVYTLPLATLFQKFGYRFDFINLDVEATNFEIFAALPFEALTGTRVICVEHDNQMERMSALVRPFGFRPVHSNGENLILAR